jgi:flagellar motor switch protein FliN/FliY
MSDETQPIRQDEVEKLLAQSQALPGGTDAPTATPTAESTAGHFPEAPQTARSTVEASSGGPAAEDIDYLFQQAQRALASIDAPQGDEPPGLAPLVLEDLVGAAPSTEVATLELLRDVELDLKIEFGRTQMYLEDVLRLRKGSVVPLDKLAGDPVDIFVNGRLIARGEVLVLNDNFCVRVAELIAGERTPAE